MSESAQLEPVRWPTGAAEPEIADLLSLADQCVKCGYCLPHCPTFKFAHDEGESPRGRIALIQGWLSGAIDDGPRVQFHLDQCLECRACEPNCPSLVRYGTLMDGARAVREQRRSIWQRGLRRVRLGLLTRPLGLRLVAVIGIGYRWLRLPQWLIVRASTYWPAIQVLHPLARALRWPRKHIPMGISVDRSAQALMSGSLSRSNLSPISNPASGHARTVRSSGGKASPAPALFRGCIARLTDQPLEAAALRLLTRLGYPPVVPDEQGCCGAIHRHNGYPSDADQLVAVNTQAFAGRPVIGLASACVAELQEQGQVNAIEVCRFLLDHPWPVEARLQPLPLTVAVHEPCSHRNQLRDQGAVYALLRRIPELSVASLPGNDTCCGAAGTYLIEHPEFALALAAPKVDALQAIKPDYLVTTNTGCALHLAARLRSAGLKTEVLHPIQLIERQLII
ncbi:MAG: (Fe-S)-binding protein [Chromatiaceae bacterium]|nr:(Fe-S)-binding protein [Chromatiaceae bacterium]MCF7994434.1 (Fe-S)-binding protein [Chromatiaceae bacterium]MCF8014824.1 (Fe-S)-binding protein [Chromatiaceae bacterium]